jgi:homoserine dehydrogenase
MATDPLRLGIAGLGTVGGGVVRLIEDHRALLAERLGREVVITRISARDRSRERPFDVAAYGWVDDPVDLATVDDVDVVVELIGGSDGPALALVRGALAAGRPVVTANKALLAHHGAALAAVAEKTGAMLAYEAAVAGGIPVVKALREGLIANRLTRIAGILNGTCNYILSRMEATGAEFADVLAEAQAHGYAEADPAFDIEGTDAAHKLTILATLGYGAAVDFGQLHVEGITSITADDIAFARELGYRIKLLGIAESDGNGIAARVHPTLVAHHTPLAEVDGVYNAVQIEGEPVGRLFLEGPGAGAGPTASAVVADLCYVAWNTDAEGPSSAPVYMKHAANLVTGDLRPMSDHVGRFYIRLNVIDRPGVMAAVTEVFARHAVSLESIIQRKRDADAPVPIVLMTHEAREAVMQAAIGEIGRLEAVTAPPCLIRLETM